MKRKLLIALLATAAITVVASVVPTAATTETWGTGGWDVPKQRTTWNPDGVWMEGEYYSVDLGDIVNYAGDTNTAVKDFSMGMSWDETYLYTFITYRDGFEYSRDNVWDGSCIQIGGTDYGNETTDDNDPRLEYGITWNTEDDRNRTILWSDYLNTGYADGTDTDDFAVLMADGWVTYEIRTPFSAFSELENIQEGEKVGVCYVIVNRKDGHYGHTQIGYGITGMYGKDAARHCPITLTAAPEVEENTNAGYDIHFHNIGNDHIREDFNGDAVLKFENVEEDVLNNDIMSLLDEDALRTLNGVTGYDFMGFRVVYHNVSVGDTLAEWTIAEWRHFSQDYPFGLDNTLYDDNADNILSLKDFAYDGGNDRNEITLTAVYEPKQYTIKFNNIGNVDSGENEHYWYCQSKVDMRFGDNIWDYLPDPEDTESWPYLMVTEDGDVFSHWRVLDFSKDYDDVNEKGERYYSDYWVDYTETDNPLKEDFIAYAVEGTEEDGNKENYPFITFRAVYESADTVYHSGTIGEDNIPWQITADGTLTVGTVDGEGSYSIPDWDDPWNYNWDNDDEIKEAVANSKIAPWFPYRDEVKALVIGNDINHIGNHSFRDHTNIRGNVTIPGSVKTIGEWAFHNNYFASITIENGVENINGYAFNESNKVTTIHIPASVSYISEEAFKWCDNVKAFTVDENSQDHCAIDGVLFTKDATQLIRYPWAKADTSYTVPETVTVLKPTCFEASYNLTEIILPEGLETIGYWALANLNVTELVIPASVNTVRDSAFRRNYKLTDIYFQGNKPDDWQGSLLYLYDEKTDRDYLRSDLKIHYNAAAERWGDITGEYGDYMVIDGGYVVRFLDDDGDTELLDTQYLALGNSITVPTAETRYYGNFDHWQAWDRDYSMNRKNLTLTQDLLNEAGTDTNWDGVNDTIVFEANYAFYDDAGDYRAYGEIDNNDDGINEVWWRVTWDRTLEIGSLVDDMVSIPDYPDCYADDYAYQNAERAPWHEYANYIRELNWCGVKDYIGSYAFADLYLLNGVSIPSEVKTVGTCAFIGCTNISWINIGDGVETIYHDAFCDVDMNNGIWIPASVTHLDDQAFINCRVNRFEVDSNNPNYWNDEQGILYKHNGDGTSTLLAYPKNNGVQAVVVPEGVTTIYERAFEGARDIYSIQLPESLTTIGYSAFRWADNLRVIHIPEKVSTIGRDAFEGDYNLQGAYFYGNAPEIGDGIAFNNCAGDFKVYYIEGKTGFNDIGYNTDTFNANDNYAEGVIDYNWNEEHVHLNWYITKDGWLKVEGNTSIPDHEHPWWEYLAYVRKVDIDDNITHIGDSAFCNLTHVDTINLPKDLKYVGDSAFNADGSSGNNIGAWILPGKLTTIRKYAFGNLGITKVTIPASLEEIESGWAFFDNPITTYAVENGSTNFGVDSYGALYELDENGNYVALVAYPRDAEFMSYTVPNGVKTLYGASIRNACNLTEVILPDTLEVIHSEALAHFYNDVRTLTIPASVKTIYSNAFRWGNKTSVVFLGNKPEFINDGENEGNQFWDNLDNQIVVYYYEGTTGWDSYDPQDINTYMLKAGEEPFVAQGYFWDGWDIQWTLDKNGVLNVYGTGEIPDYWGGYDWHDYDFWDKVKEIEIHEGITSVGAYMFWGGSGLTRLTLPSTLTSINEYAFASNYYDNTIGELVLPEGLKSIGDFAFHRTGLTKVTIPSTLESIESHAFVRNQIKEFVVNEGNGCYSVDEYGVLFEKREHEDEDGNGRGEYFLRLHSYPAGSSMTSYTVPEKLNEMDVGEIGDWAFTNAQNLTKVELSNVWGICGGGFLHCNNITSLELINMHWLSAEAIFGCEKLTSIIIDGRIPEVFTWEEGYNMPFVNNGVNCENDDLVVYYYSDAENMERLDVLREYYTLKELTHSNLKGDVNDDGKVDKDDLTILQQYYAGYNVTIANKDNADIDGENGLTRRDVMILARYLANWGDDYSNYFN